MKRKLLLFTCILLSCHFVFSQSYREWTGSGNNWNTSSNWTSGGIAYGQLEWKGNGQATSNNDAGSPFNTWRLYFSGSRSYTLTGNAVSLFDFSTQFSWVLNDATVAQNINLPINFADAGARYSYITNRSTGSLTFGSGNNIGITGASITALRIAANNTTAPITFNGTISGSRPIDIGRDNDNADQVNTRVFFNGNNSSYSGVTTLYAGTLTIPANSALGSGLLIIGNGTTTNTLSVSASTSRSQGIQVNNTSSAAVIDVASGQTFELTGVLSGGATNTTKIGKSGIGTLTLTGTATYNGQIQIGDGSVIANSNTAISTNTTTSARGVDLGLNVGDVSTANNVSLLVNNGFTVGNSIYVASNASGATRTIGLNGSGSATFSNEIYMDGNLTVSGGSGTVIIGGRLTNTGGIIANGGIVTLTASNNNFSGTSTVNSGAELRLNPASNATYASQVVLNGGTLSTTNVTATRTFTSSNTLNLNTSSTIALGAGNHALNFANSSAVTWNGTTLTITGWTGTAGQSNSSGGKIFFGNNSSGLSSTQLAKINFSGFGTGATILSTGEIVPINPIITLSQTNLSQFTTQNLTRNTSNSPIARFQVDVTDATAQLSSMSFSTTGDNVNCNYVQTDITNFKLYYTTSTSFTSLTLVAGATTQTSGKILTNSSETITFSALTQTLAVGTYYFWVTADILQSATAGRNIILNSQVLTASLGSVSGSGSVTGIQTIIAAAPTSYYLQANAAGTAANWNTDVNGSGTVLSSLSAPDVNLIVDNETAATITGDITLGNNSKFIVSQGTTAKLTITTAVVTGTIDVGSAGTLEINTVSIPTLGTLASGSTITYGFSGNQTFTATSYSSLILAGSGIKTFGSDITISGTLTVPNGVTLNAGSNVISGTGSLNVESGATLIVGHTSGLNGFNTTSGSSTYSTGANYTFNGTSSQVLGAALPSTVNNLTISNGNPALALGGKTITGALTLSGGTKLVIGSNTLTLNGTVSGMDASNCLITTTSSNISVGGSGAVGSLFFDATNNALNNLTINNSYTSGAAVTLGNTLNVSGVVTPTAGQLATGGNLVLVSIDETGGGAIGNASANTAFANNYITGNVTGQRYTRAQRGYRALGHPFSDAQNLGILTDDFAITGLTTTGGGTYALSSSVPTAFLYDPTKTGATNVLTRLTDATANVWTRARGLYVFVRGAGSEGMTGGSGAANYGTGHNPVTIDGTGAINQGPVTYNLGYADGMDNYNLIGNPYPCPINLRNVTNIGNYGTVYVYNPRKNFSGSNQYTLCGGFDQYTNDGSTDIIVPAFGAFYVQATGSGQSITFNESDKAVGSTPNFIVFGGIKKPIVRLSVANANGVIDELKLGINNGSSDASTDKYDAAKLSNSLFNFYSITSDRKSLAIDYRANFNSIIPLGIQTNLNNTYSISLSELTDLPNTQVVLRDKLLKTETILSQVGDSYSFAITADTATKGENRFEIGLLGTTVLPVQIADITAQLQANKTVAVNWTSTTEVNLASYKVQRSKDGSNFSTVGTVAAKGASAYSYDDDLNTAGILPATVYYRLEAVDKDGSKTYSKVVSCQLSVVSTSMSIYPNPVQSTLFAQVTVSKAGAAQLRVVDAQGKVVATQKTQLAIGTTSISIPATQLSAGNYVLEIDTMDGKQTQRFVKE